MYTKHGHYIPHSPEGDPGIPQTVQFCGGIDGCVDCAREAIPFLPVNLEAGVVQHIKEGLPDEELEKLLAEEEKLDRTPHTHEVHVGVNATSIPSKGLPHVHQLIHGRDVTEWYVPESGMTRVATHYHRISSIDSSDWVIGTTSLPYWEDGIEADKEKLGRALLEQLKQDRSSIGLEAIRERFGWHKSTELTGPMHRAVRELFIDGATILDCMLPNGRAKFQALVELELACMWANKAIGEMSPVVDDE